MLKIGLVTFFKSYNYGVWLQAYATQQFLTNLGYDVEIINYCNDFENSKLKYAYKEGGTYLGYVKSFIKSILFGKVKYYKCGFKCNIDKYYNISKEYKCIKEMQDVDYDVLMVGSDQVWNPSITNGLEDVFLLNFGGNQKRISFASSLGSSELDAVEEKRLIDALLHFSSISVREDFAKEYLQKYVEKDIKVLLDPTFMLKKEQWIEKLAKDSKYYNCKEKYILTYFISYEKYKDECIKYIENYSAEMQIPIWSVQFSKYYSKTKGKQILGASISDFVALMMNAELIITDSFHGTAMSVNLNKSFVVWNNSSNPMRIVNLLNKLGLSDRIKMSLDEYEKVDYSDVNKTIDQLRIETTEWLKSNLS